MGGTAIGPDGLRRRDAYTNPGTPWLGRTVFCLASGDSLRRVSPARWMGIRAMQRREAVVIAVNSSVKTARQAGCEPDGLFFTDKKWFDANATLVETFRGRAFTVCPPHRAKADRLERVHGAVRKGFGVGQPPMRDGRSSGHRAVSLAVMLGAAKVVLLGYDMRIDPVSGRSHCHDDYSNTQMGTAYEREFIPSFDGWCADARAVGCEIVNATEGSALKEFPMVHLDDILAAGLAA